MHGFTIVELLVVIVVITILASITTVAYNGITGRAKESALASNLSQAAKKLEVYKTTDPSTAYPVTYISADVSQPTDTTYTYTGGATYCLEGTYGGFTYYVSHISINPTKGNCPVVPPPDIQTITSTTCPTSRTVTVDARDNHTYWVQKLGDNKCWMLTNLAYAGAGANTYGDAKVLGDGTGGSATYTSPRYYVHAKANPTTSPTLPSTSTDAGATNSQYGYFYNWCGAMGGQATAACANATTPTPNTAITVCPAGWRLPTGNGGEFTGLNVGVNGGLTNTDAGLRTSWLGQRGGFWANGSFSSQGSFITYWSSTHNATYGTYAYNFYADSSYVNPVVGDDKGVAFAVRCVAN